MVGKMRLDERWGNGWRRMDLDRRIGERVVGKRRMMVENQKWG
jgi:hypothetical protein